jgi:hypothetical protein
MPEAAVAPELDVILEKLSKIRIEIGGSFDIPFLKAIFDFAAKERETMDKEILKRIDGVKAQIAEDSYAIYRKALVTLGLLDPLPKAQ